MEHSVLVVEVYQDSECSSLARSAVVAACCPKHLPWCVSFARRHEVTRLHKVDHAVIRNSDGDFAVRLTSFKFMSPTQVSAMCNSESRELQQSPGWESCKVLVNKQDRVCKVKLERLKAI